MRLHGWRSGAGVAPASAQTFPSKTITIVRRRRPAASHIIGRGLAQRFSKAFASRRWSERPAPTTSSPPNTSSIRRPTTTLFSYRPTAPSSPIRPLSQAALRSVQGFTISGLMIINHSYSRGAAPNSVWS